MCFTAHVVLQRIGVNFRKMLVSHSVNNTIDIIIHACLSHSQQTHMVKPVLARRSMIADFRYVVSNQSCMLK